MIPDRGGAGVGWQHMGAMGLTMAVIGGAYAATECMAGEFRGKKDYINSFYGGAAAGLVLGVRTGRVGVAAASAVTIGGMTALMQAVRPHLSNDLGDWSLVCGC